MNDDKVIWYGPGTALLGITLAAMGSATAEASELPPPRVAACSPAVIAEDVQCLAKRMSGYETIRGDARHGLTPRHARGMNMSAGGL